MSALSTQDWNGGLCVGRYEDSCAVLVCLPGLCGSALMWQSWAEVVSRRTGVMVVGCEYPTETPDCRAPDIDGYALHLQRFLMGVVKECPNRPILVVGHSLAAHVIMRAQSDEIRRQLPIGGVDVAGTLMVNPSPFPRTLYWGLAHGLFLKVRSLKALVLGGLVSPEREDVPYFGLAVGSAEARVAVCKPLSIPAVRQLCFTGRLSPRGYRQLWHTHVLCTKGDQVVPYLVAQQTIRKFWLPPQDVSLIPDGDHYPMMVHDLSVFSQCVSQGIGWVKSTLARRLQAEGPFVLGGTMAGAVGSVTPQPAARSMVVNAG